MALVQTAKEQTPLREWYQRRHVKQWIGEGVASWKDVPGEAPDPKKAETDMVTLATNGDGVAFYGLEIEKLCGQLNAAALTALDDPASHADLLKVLASEAPSAKVLALLAGPGPAPAPTVPPAQPAPPTAQQAAYTDARNAVTSQIRRAIDALQIRVNADWSTRLQEAALVLSVCMAVVLVYNSPTMVAIVGKWGAFPFGLFLGVIGGFLAPVSRDVIAALQNLRT